MYRRLSQPTQKSKALAALCYWKASSGKRAGLVGLSALNSIIDERLVDAASDAVLQWRYDPTLLNGRPVETVVTISVAFEIP